MRFKEEIEYENQDDVAMAQTTTTSRMVQSTTFLGQIKMCSKRKSKKKLRQKVGQTFAFYSLSDI